MAIWRNALLRHDGPSGTGHDRMGRNMAVKARERLLASGIRIVLWGIAAALLATPAWALDDVQARQTLHGLGAIRVTVEVDPFIEQENPALKAQLQEDIERRLYAGGIVLEPTAVEWLHVSLHTHNANPGVAFSVHVDLEQLVQLMRGPHMIALSPTWGTGGVGILPDLGPTSQEFLRTSVANSVDQFIAAYRRENPLALGER